MKVLLGSEPLGGGAVVRAAEEGEAEVVLDLLAEAAAWLRERGIAQWPARFPVDSVRRQIEADEALLVERADRPIATLCVAADDIELWGPTGDQAYYVSRLAVARSASGAGLGYRLLDWVEAKAAARGWPYIRLATSKDNPGLRRHYERARFHHVADPLHSRWPTSLYQRAVRRGRSA